MKLTPRVRIFLLVLPAVLVLSTAFVFASLSQALGKPAGYVGGFAFYLGFWCLLVPGLLLGRGQFFSVFQESAPLFRKQNAWLILLLLSTTAGALGMLSGHDLARTPLSFVLIALPTALFAGVCEEILWRGLYVKAFPQDVRLGLLVPTLGFALWHLAPQLVYPAQMPGGSFAFAGLTFFLGLCYGVVAYRTGSCKWTALSHGLNGMLDLGGALAPALYTLIFWQ